MTYIEALKIIEEEFETRYVDEDRRALRINLTYDGYSELYVVICDKDGEAYLSDEGESKNVFWKDADEAEWGAICEANGFTLNRHLSIERRFSSIEDVHGFIDFLLMLSDKYHPVTSRAEESAGGEN